METKFRAWDEKNKKMHGCRDFWISADGHTAAFGDDGHIYYTHLKLLQFTGLQDKNGVDIYEGDIVNGVIYKDYTEHVGKVLYDYNGYRISTKDKSLPLALTEKLKVIGNIHEHGELLND